LPSQVHRKLPALCLHSESWTIIYTSLVLSKICRNEGICDSENKSLEYRDGLSDLRFQSLGSLEIDTVQKRQLRWESK
jgi:hypothetical protein